MKLLGHKFQRILIAVNAALMLALIIGVFFLSSAIRSDATARERMIEDLYVSVYSELANDSVAALGDADAVVCHYADFLISRVLRVNNCTPAILVVHEDGRDVVAAPFNLSRADSLALAAGQDSVVVKKFKSEGTELLVDLGGGEVQHLFLGNSPISVRLTYIVSMQVALALLAVAMVFLLFQQSIRRERDSIWRGLALETAHQLGTPTSALVAWRDLLEMGYSDTAMVAAEMTKDIERLNTVAERFSKIGSVPTPEYGPLEPELRLVVDYLATRIAKNITISLRASQETGGVQASHIPVLLRWAVENICKNAAQAIPADRGGVITVSLFRSSRYAIIDITDNGRGMDSATAKRVFDAGFSTKNRGWGMGLALVRRIVEEYHHGKVAVHSSEPGVGTTFRIRLPLG